MVFWQVLLLFSVFSALFILWPLVMRWKAHRKALRHDHRADVNDAVQADRKQELDENHVLGEIDQSELRSLKRDLDATLAAEISQNTPHSSQAMIVGTRSRRILFAVAMIIPFCVVGAYFLFGAKADWEIRELAIELNSSPDTTEDERRVLVDKLNARITQTPENGHLWYLLASTASSIGDFEQAVSAYTELDALYPETPTILADLAQALFLRAGNVITPDVRKYTQKALDIDPDFPTALGLSGIDAFQAGKYQEAITLWQRAVQRLDPSSQASSVLSRGIAQAQIALKATSGGSDTAKQEDGELLSLRVSVKLADEVAATLTGDETVFIYARAWQGSKAPLGVKRLRVSDLPAKVVLDKGTAMIAGRDVTSVSQLEVIARVSQSNNPIAQPGDWSASVGPVILTEVKQKIQLTVSEQLQVP